MNKTDEIAIKVSNVSKSFKLPHEKNSSVKSFIVNPFKKRTFEKQEVLKNINFEIKRGEFFGIVGRNGSGKSTLLKLLAGIYSPDKGHIQINGKLTPFIELGVGFNPELTGRENVYLNGALLGFNRKEMNVLYDEIVEFAELEKFMDQKLKNYSSGMQVRLAFSIAIQAKTDILLLDEVLAVGDTSFQRKCFDYFMQLKKDKQTVVLVTHDMGAVRQYCDRAMLIDAGKIIDNGKAEDIAQAYQRLFSENTRKPTAKNSSRWGTGKLISVSTDVKIKSNHILIKSTYCATIDLEPPVLGFTIYGPSGNNIFEGNTLRKKISTKTLKKDEEITIEWSVQNILASGTYKVSVACCDQSATEFYDWLNEAATFIIAKEGNTAGLVDPDLEVKII
jgi:ABC-2 type transport system ATP-binding protein